MTADDATDAAAPRRSIVSRPEDPVDRRPEAGSASDTRRWPASRIALAAVIAAGVALRAVRLFAEGYHGDEPFEIFVRRAVLDHGWPLLPSGQVSAYGGVLLWPGAIGTWIGGMSVFWNRLPMFVLGCAALWIVGRTAARRLGPWAGVAAAAVLAFHPGHIEWTTNVKIYGAMTLFTACAADAWLAWLLDDDARAPRRFALCATLAALVHPAAAFTVAGFAVGGLCMRGPRWAFAPRTLLTFAVPGAALAAFALVMRYGDPTMTGHLVAAGGGGSGGSGGEVRRVIKHLWAALGSHGWHSTWHAVPFALAAIGSAFALVRLAMGRGRESTPAGRVSPAGRTSPERTTLATTLAWGAGLAAMATISRHQGAMYLLPTFPLLAIGAAGGLRGLWGTGVGAGSTFRAAALGAVALGLHVAATWGAWPETFDRREGIARVWRHLADESKPGEVSLGGGPHAVLYSKGNLDDFMIYGGDLGASSFLKDGRPYDRYLGNPVLGTVDMIRPVVEAAPRTWYFIADKEIALVRVTPEVHAWLTSRMHLVAETPGMRLYATPPR